MEGKNMSINDYGWADWNLKKVEIDFEKVNIIVSDHEDGTLVAISCNDYIGLKIIGHWDEAIIEDIVVSEAGELIDQSIDVVKEKYGSNPVLGGGVKKIHDKWLQLEIRLIDGISLTVACRDIIAKGL